MGGETGVLEHEAPSVLFMDAQHQRFELKQMLRGTATQTLMYPREAITTSQIDL